MPRGFDHLPFKIGQQVETNLYPGVVMTIVQIKHSRDMGYFFTVYICDWDGKPPHAMDAFYAGDLKAVKKSDETANTGSKS